MHLKKYHVRSMPEALARVKAEMGSDAVIVEARRRRRFGLWGAAALEVTAAVDTTAPPAQRPPERSPARSHAGQRTESSPGDNAASVAALGTLEALRRELSSLRGRVERLAQERELPHYRQAVRGLVRRLIDQELSPEMATQIASVVERELSDAALTAAPALGDAVRRELARLVPLRDPLGEPGRRVLFLVGPTGVGKTTTLAKLAANFVLRGRGPVALVTADTYRIAGIPQLQTYAEIISVPLDVAYAPDDLRAIVAAHADKALVLIDTPGRSQHNGAQLSELRAFVRAAAPCEVLLTVSGNVRRRDLEDIAERFSRVSYDGLIVTKLDETRTHGAPLNLAHQIGVPLTYLTTGQNVPQDIETATAERLCGLLLGEVREC